MADKHNAPGMQPLALDCFDSDALDAIREWMSEKPFHFPDGTIGYPAKPTDEEMEEYQLASLLDGC